MTASRLAFPLFLLGSAMLSVGPLLVRLADVGAVQSAFWRVALGVLPLLLIARLVDRAPTGGDARPPTGMLWFALAGLFFAADLAAWHLGIERTTLANASLFANATAFMLPLWGYAVARTWPGVRPTVALLLAGGGTALLLGVSAELSPRHLAGDLICLLAALFYTAYLLTLSRVRGRTPALTALARSTLASAVLLLPVALLAPGGFWPGDWTPLVMLALGSQVVGQGLIIYALPHLAPIAAGVGLLFQPMLTAAMGWLWFDERLGLAEAVGAGAILVALVLVRLPDRRVAAVEA